MPRRIQEYTAISRWAINAEIVVTHRVSYTVLDDEFDLVSDNMLLWSSQPQRHGGWSNRWPEQTPQGTPSTLMPRMDIFMPADGGGRRDGHVKDAVIQRGLILERHERHALPRLEADRLLVKRGFAERTPLLEHAFDLTQAVPAVA
ncbi:DUF6012 family protein [Pseudomonas citronellolis]|uniref:DUF6012 family protein n=1 Tax=Pseudomonas citronellolis TaxID=53408 RepID=UPI00389A6DDF